MQKDFLAEKQILDDFKSALEHHEFVPYYQLINILWMDAILK